MISDGSMAVRAHIDALHLKKKKDFDGVSFVGAANQAAQHRLEVALTMSSCSGHSFSLSFALRDD